MLVRFYLFLFTGYLFIGWSYGGRRELFNSINYNREYPPPRAKSAAGLARACMRPWGYCPVSGPCPSDSPRWAGSGPARE